MNQNVSYACKSSSKILLTKLCCHKLQNTEVLNICYFCGSAVIFFSARSICNTEINCSKKVRPTTVGYLRVVNDITYFPSLFFLCFGRQFAKSRIPHCS